MKLLYMGTGASEGVPCPFCPCPACERARREGGREARTRSGVLIDGALKLDFPPDSPHQALSLGVSFENLEHVLITHTHHDHLAYWLLALTPSQRRHRAQRNLPLRLYGNEAMAVLLTPLTDPAVQPIRVMEAFKPIEVAGYTVTALPAFHKPDERALNYLIEKDGTKILYAHDTGPFQDEVLHFLRGAAIDFISLDATKGAVEDDYPYHMSIRENLALRERLVAIGAARPSAAFVANHFSHNGLLPHFDMERLADGMLVAWDGMEIDTDCIPDARST